MSKIDELWQQVRRCDFQIGVCEESIDNCHRLEEQYKRQQEDNKKSTLR